MCVQDYDFSILDNAYVIHYPHMKTKLDFRKQMLSHKEKVNNMTDFVKTDFIYGVHSLHGRKPTCTLSLADLTEKSWNNFADISR